ncbi:MAG: hypothetical protein IRY91_00810, partial [Gemmatimonadaceae bacterium]|nr:hypothetical protein [Gemmatimonadaceae bacterium]
MRITRSPWALALAPLTLLSFTACSDTKTPDPTAPAPSLDVVAGAISMPVISGITVGSGRKYVVGSTGMAVGSKLFTDRSYAAKSPLPSMVAGAAYIMAADDDKAAKPGSSNFLSFDVDRDVTVYVAHDARVAVPDWLRSSFQDAGTAFYATDYYSTGEKRLLFKKNFPKGHVTLGSNVPANYDVAGNMYTVMVVSASGSSGGSGGSTGITVALKTPSDSATVSGTVRLEATASSPAGIDRVQFLVDGKAVSPTERAAPYTGSWNTTTFADGNHTLTVVATDSAGKSNSMSALVKVKNGSGSSDSTGSGSSGGSSGGGSSSGGSSSGPHSGWYVSPNGSSSGSGSSSSPWSLATAFAGGNGKIQPGDTVWLRGGTYRGSFHPQTRGTASAPIIFRQYPGERATIDGNLSVDGQYTWFWGMELTNSSTSTTNLEAVTSHCPGCRFINMVIHDASGSGLGLWSEGPDQEAYGNILYNVGYYAPGANQWAHGIYAQNQTGTKRLINNLLFDTFGYGFHIYGSDAAYLRNFTID